MKLYQQTENCSDFDISLDGDSSPSFRVLLPEHIEGAGLETRFVHTHPGTWATDGQQTSGRLELEGRVRVDIEIHCTENLAAITMSLSNLTNETMTNLSANICTAVNQLPSESPPDWSNRRFIPDEIPLDRFEQGDYWFEQHTPNRLFALTGTDWVHMHPNPAEPVGMDRPRFAFNPSEQANAQACAVESLDGSEWFYQAWNRPCYYCTPCCGNGCMHLVVCIADSLEPGESVTLKGWIGSNTGNQNDLSKHINGLD